MTIRPARIAVGLAGAAAAIALTPGVAFAGGPAVEAPTPAVTPAAPAQTPAPADAAEEAPPAPIEAPTAVPAGNGGEAGTTSDTARNATIGSGIAGAALVAGSAVSLVRRRIREEGSH